MATFLFRNNGYVLHFSVSFGVDSSGRWREVIKGVTGVTPVRFLLSTRNCNSTRSIHTHTYAFHMCPHWVCVSVCVSRAAATGRGEWMCTLSMTALHRHSNLHMTALHRHSNLHMTALHRHSNLHMTALHRHSNLHMTALHRHSNLHTTALHVWLRDGNQCWQATRVQRCQTPGQQSAIRHCLCRHSCSDVECKDFHSMSFFSCLLSRLKIPSLGFCTERVAQKPSAALTG